MGCCVVYGELKRIGLACGGLVVVSLKIAVARNIAVRNDGTNRSRLLVALFFACPLCHREPDARAFSCQFIDGIKEG